MSRGNQAANSLLDDCANPKYVSWEWGSRGEGAERELVNYIIPLRDKKTRKT